MIAKANARIASNGWENVDVVRADATTAELGGPYDAAIATLALGVMPDIERAVRNIHSALGPGAPLGVLDIRRFQSGLRRVVNPLLGSILTWYANWNPDEDVPAAIDSVFGDYDQFQTYMLGMVYTLEATRRNSGK